MRLKPEFGVKFEVKKRAWALMRPGLFYSEKSFLLCSSKKSEMAFANTAFGVVPASLQAAEAPERPENSFKSAKRKDIYLDWFDTLRAAQAHVKEARLA